MIETSSLYEFKAHKVLLSNAESSLFDGAPHILSVLWNVFFFYIEQMCTIV